MGVNLFVGFIIGVLVGILFGIILSQGKIKSLESTIECMEYNEKEGGKGE